MTATALSGRRGRDTACRPRWQAIAGPGAGHAPAAVAASRGSRPVRVRPVTGPVRGALPAGAAWSPDAGPKTGHGGPPGRMTAPAPSSGPVNGPSPANPAKPGQTGNPAGAAGSA